MSDYLGICPGCFEPVKSGHGRKISKNGSYFHDSCIEESPQSYYVFLETIKAEYENGSNLTELMNRLEKRYNIPMINDEFYNEENAEVMKLYREIANARKI
jgi:hypothetical protein